MVMEYKEFFFELRSKGIYIEQVCSRFIVGYYEQAQLKYATAVQWVRDQGGHIPTMEQALILCEHRREINEALLAAGQKPISEEYFWCRRQHAIKQGSNYIVRMYNGYIDQCSRDYYSAARAIIPVK